MDLIKAVPEAPTDDSGSYIFEKNEDPFDALKTSWDYQLPTEEQKTG